MSIEAGAIQGSSFFPTGPDFGGINAKWRELRGTRETQIESVALPIEPTALTGEMLAASMPDSLAAIADGDIISRRHITQDGKEWADTIGRDVLFQLQQHHGRDEITENEFSSAMSSMYAHEKTTRLADLKKNTPAWIEAKAQLANLNRVRASACGSFVSGRLYGKSAEEEVIEEQSHNPSRLRRLGLAATALLGIFGAVKGAQRADEVGPTISPNPIVRDVGVYGDVVSHSDVPATVQQLDTERSEQVLTEADVFPVGATAQSRMIFPDGRVEELESVTREAAGSYDSLSQQFGPEVAPTEYSGLVDVDYGDGTVARLTHSVGSDNGIVLKKGPAYLLQQMVERGDSIKGVKWELETADGAKIVQIYDDAIMLTGNEASFGELPYNPELAGKKFQLWCEKFRFGSPLIGSTIGHAAAVYTTTIEAPNGGVDTVANNGGRVQQTSQVIFDAGNSAQLNQGFDAARSNRTNARNNPHEPWLLQRANAARKAGRG